MKEFPQPGLILADIGINLAVGALEIGVAHKGRTAVARTGDVNHVEIVFFDDPVQVSVDEILPGRRAPMSEQHVFDIFEFQRAFQQRVVVKINLADGEIIGGAPVGVHFLEKFRRQSFCFGFVHCSILF